MSDVRRQFRTATILIIIVVPLGIGGYMLIEGRSFVEAVWLTIITLSTIGYGDLVPISDVGRLFTLVMIFFGLGALLFFFSTSFALFFSAEATAKRRRRRTQRMIRQLRRHYIICGSGEMVDKTIGYVLHSAEIRRNQHQDAVFRSRSMRLRKLLGDIKRRSILRRLFLLYYDNFVEHITLLDLLVVVTEDADYADRLRSAGLLVVDGEPTDNNTLQSAGIDHARAIMVMLDQDSDCLLAVLTARNLNPLLYITAAAVEADLMTKILKAGANNVIAPYEVAAQFLNSATLRPAVNGFFYSILFDQETQHQITQLELRDDSPWIGKRLAELRLRKSYSASIIGIRTEHGGFEYAPSAQRVLAEDEVLLAVAPGPSIPRLQRASQPQQRKSIAFPPFQRLLQTPEIQSLDSTFSFDESAAAIEQMSKHFIICGNDQIIRSAVRYLNPTRPFVLLTSDEFLALRWQARGFKVVHGDPTSDAVLQRAGVKRAAALMISIDDKAVAVLAVLSARSISKSLLISVTASSDDMIEKLHRTGADRVVSPFHVAAQSVLLATTRPEIGEFLHHITYNESSQLETAELYMEGDSPWIGRSIRELELQERYQAGVIGIRQANSARYVYAPPQDTVIQPYEVIIVITPMRYFDAMRAAATGDEHKRPATLRTAEDAHQSSVHARNIIRELIQRHGQD